MRHTNPVFFLLGLVVIFFALVMFSAAMRQMGRGNCLGGCCLWEMSDSLMDLGCGLMGCGGVLAVVAIPLIVWVGRLGH